MPTVTFNEKAYDCSSDESLLDGLNRQGANLSFGCRGGLCHACMVKAVKGTPPLAAQADLKPALKAKGYFLPCLCKPEEDYEIALPDRRDEFTSATITSIDHLTPSVVRLKTSQPAGFGYRPGQFVNIIRATDGLSRSYSLASIPDDRSLEFHIRLLPDGRMSGWINDALACGDEILLSDPMGDCCYRRAYGDRPLLLAGTGTGLAPLYGILRDAIATGHRGEIHLLHGAIDSGGLYLDSELREIAASHDNITYTPTVLSGPTPAGGSNETIDALVSAQMGQGREWVAFLCGDSKIVADMRRACTGHGMNESDIHSDAFG